MDIRFCVEAAEKQKTFERVCELYRTNMDMEKIPEDVKKIIEEEIQRGSSVDALVAAMGMYRSR